MAGKSVRDYVRMMDSSLWSADLAGIFTGCHYGSDGPWRGWCSRMFRPACRSARGVTFKGRKDWFSDCCSWAVSLLSSKEGLLKLTHSCDSEEKSIAFLATWCFLQRYIYLKYSTIYELYDSLGFRQNCLLQHWSQKNKCPAGAHTISSCSHQRFSHTCADWRQTAALRYLCICVSHSRTLLTVRGRHVWGSDVAFNIDYNYPNSNVPYKYTNSETAILLKHTYAHRQTHSWVKIYTGPSHAQT